LVGGLETPNRLRQRTSRLRLGSLHFGCKPDQDLKSEILALARREGVQAGAVVTCVGSLTTVKLRLANRSDTTTRTGHFEIVSLVGTVDPAGGHLHLCVTDGDGTAFGGHLVDGCVVYTTAEVVLADLTGLEFRREVDPKYGYKELAVYPRVNGR
jgi:predicted DNA-binding protein with PD1-like motif